MIYLLDLKEGDKITLDNSKDYVSNADLPNYNISVANEFSKHKVATLVRFPYDRKLGATFVIGSIRFFVPSFECKYFSKV